MAGRATAASRPSIADPAAGAPVPANLTYVTPDAPGLARRKSGKGFRYLDTKGHALSDIVVLDRIHHLAIPPAWTEVWICADPAGHLQAVGYDARGRRQYIYHPDFRAHRDAAKYEHMIAFAEGLPALRERIDHNMRRPGFGRERVLATIAHLLETTMIRVGNAAYAKENGSFGLTTLRNRHVDVEGAALHFHFKGKSGKAWRLALRDRRVANIVRAMQDLPGQHLFQYLDDEGELHAVTSADVNAYLKEASGQDITAKDFRTWFGTVLTAMILAAAEPATSQAAAKRTLDAAIREVAEHLGNTAAICRKCYVHPEVTEAYLAGELALHIAKAAKAGKLAPEEQAVLSFLKSRTRAG